MTTSTWSWQAGPPEDLASWLDELLGGPPPPTYLLDDRRSHPPFFTLFDVLGVPDGRRDPDSGTLRFRLPEGPQFDALVDAGPADRAAFVVMEDERILLQPERHDGTGLIWTVRTTIREQSLPTIGPGGRLDLYQTAGSGELVLSVRHRNDAVGADWRPRSEMLEELDRVVAEWVPGGEAEVSVTTHYGYFELSAHDFQESLHPALGVVVEQERRNGGAAWRRVVVLPVTRGDVDEDGGFGSWELR